MVLAGKEAPEYGVASGYDPIGNRLMATENGHTVNYTPNSLNQYDSVGGTAPDYDANGNLPTDGARTHEWGQESSREGINTTNK